MENKSKIGEAFADGFKDLKLEPSADVWAKVSQHTPKASPGLSAGLKAAIVAVTTVAILSIVAVMYFNQQVAKDNVAESTPKIEQELKQAPVVPNNPAPIVSIDTSVTHSNPSPSTPQADSQVEEEKLTTQTDSEISPEIKPIEPSVSSETTSSPAEENNTPNVQKPQNEISEPAIVQSSTETTPFEKDIQTTTLRIDSSITYTEDLLICIGEPTRLSVNGGEFYLWSTGEVTASIVVEPKKNMSYTVTVTDKYAHEHTHVYNVRVDEECTTIFVPNAFSPDGYNNVKFKAYATNLQSFNMQIFNRKGQLIFNTSDINSGWDGSFNGAPMQSQTFVYIIEYVNGRGVRNIKKGQFTLIR